MYALYWVTVFTTEQVKDREVCRPEMKFHPTDQTEQTEHHLLAEGIISVAIYSHFIPNAFWQYE